MPQAPRGVAGRWRPEPSACALPPQLSFQRKVGILYCRAGQGSEEEMYNNQEAGPAFMQFLTLLGDVVRLKGFVRAAPAPLPAPHQAGNLAPERR